MVTLQYSPNYLFLGFSDSIFDANQAVLGYSGPLSTPSFEIPSPNLNDSLDTLCMILNNNNINFSKSPMEEPQKENAQIKPKTARSIALAVLSRIARLLGIGIDSLLADILPSRNDTSQLSTDINASPAPKSIRDQLLVNWGRMAFLSLTDTNEHGFVSSVPVFTVVQPSALALLDALASCKQIVCLLLSSFLRACWPAAPPVSGSRECTNGRFLVHFHCWI